MKKILIISVLFGIFMPEAIKSQTESIAEQRDIPEVKKKRAYPVSVKFQGLADQMKRNPVFLLAGRGVLKKSEVKFNKKLHEAVSRKRLKEVKRLISIPGIDANQQDQQGCTALHKSASQAKNKKIMKILIQKGASVSKKDKDGLTPLHYAAKSAGRDNLDYLLDKGAKINNKDNSGNTSLHVACAVGNSKAVKFLLKRGADKTIVNNAKKTAYDMAIAAGHEKKLEKFFKD